MPGSVSSGTVWPPTRRRKRRACLRARARRRASSQRAPTTRARGSALRRSAGASGRARSSSACTLQRRLGLYISSCASLFDAVEEQGEFVSVAERLGDGLANNAHHGDAHKWLVAAWRRAEAAAAPGAVVRFGDKGAGLAAHAEFCASYIGDILIQDDDEKRIVEIKNYTPLVTRNTNCPAACTLNGGAYAFGNTEERLKYKVFGTRQRGVPALGAFDHRKNAGHVPPHRGDYWDCLEKRKAQLLLISFEAGLGGMSPFAARRLRRLARMAKESGADPTDYTVSATARSFVPYHAQRLSSVCVMYGAGAIQKSIKKLMADRRRSAATAV